MRTMGTDRARETVRRLQHDITSGRWEINSRIPNEAELAAELGVGRSTVREAVRSLAHLGMLEPAPGRGTFVRSLSPVSGVLAEFAAQHSIEDLLAVRQGLEVQAAASAARRRDAAGLERLRASHEADLHDCGTAERGESPGQFHAILVELSGNQLLVELYAAVMTALRSQMRAGRIASAQDADERRTQHAALLAAVASGNPMAAAAVAATHAEEDLVAGG